MINVFDGLRQHIKNHRDANFLTSTLFYIRKVVETGEKAKSREKGKRKKMEMGRNLEGERTEQKDFSADKRRATIIMDREKYFSKMEALVDSPNTDRKLDADPTQ